MLRVEGDMVLCVEGDMGVMDEVVLVKVVWVKVYGEGGIVRVAWMR